MLRKLNPKRYIPFLWQRYWNSPTLTTYSSFAAKSLNLSVVLPLVIHRLPGPEAAVWLLISTVISFKGIFDGGFNPSFFRLFAFAMGGLDDLSNAKFERRSQSGIKEANWDLIKSIFTTMRFIYLGLSALSMVLLVTAGSFALQRPISELSEPQTGWLSWMCVCIAFPVVFWGFHYSAFLQGTNHIALLRRWDSFVQILSCLLLIGCLMLAPNLLALTVLFYSVQLFGVWVNHYLSMRVNDGIVRSMPFCKMDGAVLSTVWPVAWRSGLGVALTSGLINFTGFFYAQGAQTISLVNYLVALRFVTGIGQICQAPFYSKLPLLAKLRSQGLIEMLSNVAQRGMKLSYITYVVCICMGGWGLSILSCYNPKLTIGASEGLRLWFLIGLAIFAERYGALHIQLFSTTNRIVWHIANGVSGFLILSYLFLLVPLLGVIGYPLSFLLGYGCFYSWYSAWLSYRSVNATFWAFEKDTFLIPCFLFLIVNLTFSFLL